MPADALLEMVPQASINTTGAAQANCTGMPRNQRSDGPSRVNFEAPLVLETVCTSYDIPEIPKNIAKSSKALLSFGANQYLLQDSLSAAV
jgi:hypothetical protein